MITATEIEEQPAARAEGGPMDRINIGMDTVMKSTAELPERERDLIRWLFSHAMEQEWGWGEVERQSTLSTATLHKIWHGKYVDQTGRAIGLDGVCEKIERCKELLQARASLRRLPFVETSIWRMIAKICEETRVMQSLSFIYGASQIGKTECLKEYERRNNSGRTTYLRVPACGGAQSLMRALAEACYVSPKSSYEGLKKRVFKAFDHSKLLQIDEAHLFFETYLKSSVLRCLEGLRELHDVTGVGIVFCGTEVFKQELKTGEHSKMLRQFYRRGIYECQLPEVAPLKDLILIAGAYKLGQPRGEALATLQLLAKRDGLGRIVKVMAKSNQFAAKRNQRMTWEHFLEVNALIEKFAIAPEEGS